MLFSNNNFPALPTRSKVIPLALGSVASQRGLIAPRAAQSRGKETSISPRYSTSPSPSLLPSPLVLYTQANSFFHYTGDNNVFNKIVVGDTSCGYPPIYAKTRAFCLTLFQQEIFMGEQCQFLYKSNLYSSNSVAVPIPFQEIHPFILLRRGPSLLHLATVQSTLYILLRLQNYQKQFTRIKFHCPKNDDGRLKPFTFYQ